MTKKSLCLLLIVFLIPFLSKAEWVPLDETKSADTRPEVKIVSDDDNSTIIKISLPGFDVKQLIADGKTYQEVDILSGAVTTKTGYPQIPYIAKVLAVPDRAVVSVEVVETGKIKTFDDIYLPPARKSWFEGGEETPYAENEPAYRTDGVFPGKYVNVDPPVVFRDFRVARISVFPVRYLAASKQLQVVSSLTVKVTYGRGGKPVNPKTTPARPIAPSFAKLYRSFIFNYQQVLDRRFRDGEQGHDLMLCIMPDEFVESFQEYAQWKRESGTDIHITKFSDIGANSNNPEIIKEHISDAYFNWEVPPTYVLLVGDDGVFPKKIVVYPDYSFPNEDYFVEVDGDDFIPDMMIGRLTNENNYKLQVMLHKFLKYEKEPFTESPDWFKKGICCSNNYFASQVKTKRFAAQLMMEDGGFTSVDTLMSDGGWGGGNCSMDLDDVIDCINNGRSYLNYRGEGWSDGWSATCYEFHTSDVSGLNNGEMLPFVTSIGCGVAMFEVPGGNCFGEEWLELGSMTSPRGAIAFVGPTSNTHTTYNNKIDRGIYKGMFREGMDTPGQALLRGKIEMLNFFGAADPWVEYQFRIFCVLGDPSVHVWKDIPVGVGVEAPSSIPLGYSQPEFTVTSALGNQPVVNAEICITGEDVFATGFTDSTGKIHLGIKAEAVETLTYTVRGGNVIPFQGTLEVVQDARHVGPEEYPEITDISGNTNGLINPNEDCKFSAVLKNWGTQTANDVQATLSVSDTNFAKVITGQPVSYGNIASNGTASGDPLLFHVKTDCPVGQVITLILHVTSEDESWDYQYSITVRGCKLRYKTYLVNDNGSLQRNFRMDPGETVDLYLSVVNIGDDIASNVLGILHSDDPYITIVDSTGNFGEIPIDGQGINMSDGFQVSIASGCPTEYEAEYSLKLMTIGAPYDYQTIRNFSISVGMPQPSDYTGPDEYGYYVYSDKDTLFEQAPEYQWVEIYETGNSLNVPWNNGDYTQTVDLPFNFKYYGSDYEQVRISTDGWIAFGSGDQTAPNNYALPHDDNIHCMVAAFWDDLWDPFWGDWQKLSYFYDSPGHRFIIEWADVMHPNQMADPYMETFEIILLDPMYYTTETGDGDIIIQYKNTGKTDSNTIGIENETQTIGLQYVFNDEYQATASPLRSSTVLRFTTEAPYFSVPVSVEDSPEISGTIALEQNFPNPFVSGTTIGFTLPQAGNVSLSIYDINGRVVRTLINNTFRQAGQHLMMWDGTDKSGMRAQAGVYFYRLQTEGYLETRKMFMLK
jgi:hypothetical protein